MHYVIKWPWGQPFPYDAYMNGLPPKYYKSLGAHIYSGNKLPKSLQPYKSEEFSFEKWYEDELNKQQTSAAPNQQQYTLHEHQQNGANKIINAYNQGWRSFLEADGTGLGKTLTTLAAVTEIAKNNQYGTRKDTKANLLIVCPKSVIPQWRQTILSYQDSIKHLRIIIINYQSLHKLLVPSKETENKKSKRKPSKARQNRQLAHSGQSKIPWDFIIFDESHALKNYPSSNTSLAAVSLAKLDYQYSKQEKGKHATTPFVIFSTATPGATPLNFAVMSGFLAPLIAKTLKTNTAPKNWGNFLYDNGFSVTKGKTGWRWITVPTNATIDSQKDAKFKQKKDVLKIRDALKHPHAPYLHRTPTDIANWPEQQCIPLPLALTPQNQTIYAQVWSRFRKFLNLKGAAKDPKTALVENLRYKQKSSLLKIEEMADFIENLVETGNQVYVACEFIDTIDKYKEELSKRKITHTEISGRTNEERETNRLKFQKGQAKVVLCTIVAGLSLQADEILPDGTKATNANRVTIIHNLRANPENALQSLGRAHRNGKNSIAYFPYLENTVEEKIIQSYVSKISNMKTMTGVDLQAINDEEEIFRQAATKTS